MNRTKRTTAIRFPRKVRDMAIDGLFKWRLRGTDGRVIRRGVSYLDTLPSLLNDFRRSAFSMMNNTGADHVVYATKHYGQDGAMSCVDFCLRPMKDSEFDVKVASLPNVVVYALHRMQKAGDGHGG